MIGTTFFARRRSIALTVLSVNALTQVVRHKIGDGADATATVTGITSLFEQAEMLERQCACTSQR
jgi:hypothetical protein